MGITLLPFVPFGDAAGTSLVHQAAFCLLPPRTPNYPRLRLILSLSAQGDGSIAVQGVHARFFRVLHASVYRDLFRCDVEGNRHSGVFHSRAHLTCFRIPLSNIVISVLAGNGGLQQAATVICSLQIF